MAYFKVIRCKTNEGTYVLNQKAMQQSFSAIVNELPVFSGSLVVFAEWSNQKEVVAVIRSERNLRESFKTLKNGESRFSWCLQVLEQLNCQKLSFHLAKTM